MLVGSNLCIAHPIMWERICRNPNQPTIVVIDPRKTETAMAAAEHYAPLPKSDLSLLYGIAHILIREGWIDRAFIDAHTSGFEALARHVDAHTPGRSALETASSTLRCSARGDFFTGPARLSGGRWGQPEYGAWGRQAILPGLITGNSAVRQRRELITGVHTSGIALSEHERIAGGGVTSAAEGLRNPGAARERFERRQPVIRRIRRWHLAGRIPGIG